jgi:hypothetical protein
VIAAFDFFAVPTVTFRLLYCFFVIEHGRRRILHFNVTRHPTSDWVLQQLQEHFRRLIMAVRNLRRRLEVCDRAGRTTSAATDSRLRELPS